MLENLALSISTALFLLCNLLVNSLVPSPPSDILTPAESVAEPDVEVFVESDADDFELVGEWNSGGRIFEFTASGKLLYNDQVMTYEQSGGTITVTAVVDGSERVYTLAHEPVSARVMKLNGVTMYKTSR